VLPSVVTHADLASLCGGSRENVTRILSDFQRRGYVERDGRRFVLRKISGLARLAGVRDG
jgi:CRP-like cAMP-binding protein